ncbi:type VI secretion system tip protein VgrG [Loktanella sp. F6476L]|uniref:type VI secretion system Vgr family protein n=1 Tax=Loktanella sp. F6476L TaxID=2926405 RepID=UPI001FF52EAE|nr:type VI secretion system tip protein TssI/VgrG [Loktanella sp. F6476L]MCK0122405.1 type VI secretion system tip protein VgrG [Loktanella sp. F6476L]
MASDFLQDGRMGILKTELGENELVLLRFNGEEHVNNLFEFHVEALSTKADIDFDALVGTPAHVLLKTFEHPDQPFHGVVTAAKFDGVDENGWRYDLTLRPWFWLAGLRRNQRIFHEMSVVEILDELLSPYSHLGSPAVEKKLTKSYATLEYTVQYRESDLAFATRMMERFGISYHFAHDDSGHTLVMTDEMTEHDPIDGDSRKFQQVADRHRGNEEHFWHVAPARRITTGAIRLTDYNFKTPNAMMEADHIGDAGFGEGQIESFDFPGNYLDQGEGKALAKLRTLQERGQDHRHFATGDATSMRAGLTVKIIGDPIKGVDDPCLCLTARHSYSSNTYASGNGSGEPNYEGTYVMLPTSAPLAPERKTHVPAVQGPQTATVVGEGEIDCDEYGRILVHFAWDLAGANSMRCRVSQNWAGKGWGGMVIPRIGMEVVVEFLEGNPDMPLVTGCVYNGKNDVPYPLPANKTRSTFKTDTHQGTGFNELRFEDDKEKEEIFIHAQKDRNEKTLNCHSERIDANWVQSVGQNKSIEVNNNHVEAIGGNMNLTVGPSAISSVVSAAAAAMAGGVGSVAAGLGKLGAAIPGEGHYVETIDLTKTSTVGISDSATIGVSKSVSVGKSIDVKSGVLIAVETGKSYDLQSGETIAVQSGKTMDVQVAEDASDTVGKDKSIAVGENFSISAGKKMDITVADELSITVGKSKLVMKKDGTVQINGKDIDLKASGKVNVKATSKIIVKGSKVQMN